MPLTTLMKDIKKEVVYDSLISQKYFEILKKLEVFEAKVKSD